MPAHRINAHRTNAHAFPVRRAVINKPAGRERHSAPRGSPGHGGAARPSPPVPTRRGRCPAALCPAPGGGRSQPRPRAGDAPAAPPARSAPRCAEPRGAAALPGPADRAPAAPPAPARRLTRRGAGPRRLRPPPRPSPAPPRGCAPLRAPSPAPAAAGGCPARRLRTAAPALPGTLGLVVRQQPRGPRAPAAAARPAPGSPRQPLPTCGQHRPHQRVPPTLTGSPHGPPALPHPVPFLSVSSLQVKSYPDNSYPDQVYHTSTLTWHEVASASPLPCAAPSTENMKADCAEARLLG